MLKWYKNILFPLLMNKNIGKESILQLRKKVLLKAHGNILEIGIGSGINLSLYPDNVLELTAIDSNVRAVPITRIRVKLISESACKMSFGDNSFDTVVSTFSLCSINNLEAALSEIFRVLKPGGQFLFLEHGKSKGKAVAFIQNVCNPLFNSFAFGCNINRSYMNQIKKSGFIVKEFTYAKAPIYPKILVGYIYYGVAIKPKE